MTVISLSEIQRDFAAYLGLVEQGQVVVITSNGRPIAEIKPVVVPATAQRPSGLAAGEFLVPEDFNAPLPEQVLQDFEGL